MERKLMSQNTLRRLKAWASNRLRELHHNQSGAIALAVMAALLITLMMSLVLYDAIPATRQKIEVQSAADTAAWSQTSVDARTMNMLAFANVGKRIVFGQALFYASLFTAHIALLAIVLVAWVICLILEIIPFTACGILTQLTGDLANLANTLANEAADIASFAGEILDRSKEDMEAIDKYQTYFTNYTPWWSWGEGWRRGLRNGAYVSGWPVPELPSIVASVPSFSGIGFSGELDRLPVERAPDVKEMCLRSYWPDLGLHAADYIWTTIVQCSDCKDKVMNQGIITSSMEVALGIIGAMAVANYMLSCETNTTVSPGLDVHGRLGGDTTRPWQLTDPASFGNNQAEWYRRTSNLVFAYHPGNDFTQTDRRKYGYIAEDYTTSLDLVYKPDGFFGMARAEFSYQNGDPDLWHPSWTVRMRPVALPGEWNAYSGDYRIVSAYIDTVPYLYLPAAIGGFLGDFLTGGLGTANPVDVGRDLLKAGIAFEAMTNANIEGVSR